MRRLSPNNRKIEVEDATSMFSREMLQAMGFDLANAHLGTVERAAAIKRDLGKRKRGWLAASARQAADATLRDFNEWKSA